MECRNSADALPGRSALTSYLSNSMPEAAARGRKIALAIFDIDNMRHINEELGVNGGDLVISEVASRLKSAVRGNDFISRFGGHKFALVIFYNDMGRVTETLDKAMNACSAPMTVGDRVMSASISVGCSVFPECSNRVEEVISMADQATMRARAAGGGQSVLFDHSMRKDLDQRKWVDSHLIDAMTNDKIRPFFQPLIDIKQAKVVGFEVLARWVCDDTTVFPDQFIAAAERSGQICPMTFHLLNRTCEFATKLGGDHTYAINLSPVHLRSPDEADKIIELINSHGLGLDRFEFEVTENVVIDDMKTAAEFLGRLRQAGASIGLDDFGAGYSSLQYIRGLPFDKIKIDRAYITDINKNDGSTIVNAIISLSRALGFKVTAEGIEDYETADLLDALDCDRGQGWLWSKAVPAEEVSGKLAELDVTLREHQATNAAPPMAEIDLDNLPDMPEEFLEYA
ncbi:MAG: bifunctional diguanylate cyclase/phosphodiesterase [Pseudomonadota bacterium]